MFVLVRIQFHNHVDTQPVKRFKRYKRFATYIRYQIWNGQVRENEISLRKWSGGSAHLRTLEGTMLTTLLIIPGL